MNNIFQIAMLMLVLVLGLHPGVTSVSAQEVDQSTETSGLCDFSAPLVNYEYGQAILSVKFGNCQLQHRLNFHAEEYFSGLNPGNTHAIFFTYSHYYGGNRLYLINLVTGKVEFSDVILTDKLAWRGDNWFYYVTSNCKTFDSCADYRADLKKYSFNTAKSTNLDSYTDNFYLPIFSSLFVQPDRVVFSYLSNGSYSQAHFVD